MSVVLVRYLFGVGSFFHLVRSPIYVHKPIVQRMLLAIQQISEKVCQKRHIRVDIGLYIAIVGSYKGVAEIPRMPFKQILPAAICLKK